jgi:hypothetical protein
VGPNEVEISVHEEAIANQSTALSTLMRGDMSESKAGVAAWKDVGEDTFIRFTQFAYTGDYSVPKMIVSQQVLPPDEDETEVYVGAESQNTDDLGWGLRSVKKSKKKIGFSQIPRSPTSLSTPFRSLTYPLLQPRSKFAQTCEPSVIKGPEGNIGDAILCHTSLYILAEKWGVESLKTLTLLKLHQTLSLLKLGLAEVPHILELVRYGYSGTPDFEVGIDELRELICQYVAANAKIMSGHTEFMALMEEGGAFVRDLWKCVLPRIG